MFLCLDMTLPTLDINLCSYSNITWHYLLKCKICLWLNEKWSAHWTFKNTCFLTYYLSSYPQNLFRLVYFLIVKYVVFSHQGFLLTFEFVHYVTLEVLELQYVIWQFLLWEELSGKKIIYLINWTSENFINNRKKSRRIERLLFYFIHLIAIEKANNHKKQFDFESLIFIYFVSLSFQGL